nr:hypothetical protein BaRGS_023485 [Batillaria attramentaria]
MPRDGYRSGVLEPGCDVLELRTLAKLRRHCFMRACREVVPLARVAVLMMMARPGRGGGGCGSRWPGLSPPDCQTDQPPSASADRIHLSQLQLLQPPTNQPAPHGLIDFILNGRFLKNVKKKKKDF